ncbi:hypothetical protein NKR23_g12332 [Pleurostoma richardsiae]|uniref:Uncharacterized protein n=1 Tax=Pleurostoma richardsiae TaxID=41990 RepID=A0AA38R1Z0_9PEZI|nr:hypothetical protein NKR23_g12332 [Pleurostoma richardsiae]
MQDVRYIGAVTVQIDIVYFSSSGTWDTKRLDELQNIIWDMNGPESRISGQAPIAIKKSDLDGALELLGIQPGKVRDTAAQRRQDTLKSLAAVVGEDQSNKGGAAAANSTILLSPSPVPAEDGNPPEGSTPAPRISQVSQEERLTLRIQELTQILFEKRLTLSRLLNDEQTLQKRLEDLVERVSKQQERLDQACIDRQEPQERIESEANLFEADDAEISQQSQATE